MHYGVGGEGISIKFCRLEILSKLKINDKSFEKHWDTMNKVTKNVIFF